MSNVNVTYQDMRAAGTKLVAGQNDINSQLDALKREIIALFKRVDGVLTDLTQIKDDIRSLVERYKQASSVDVDETEAAENLELPGADLSHEELAVEVKPKQLDEFTCMSCFLVHHRSQLADEKKLICRDCI